MQLTFHAKATLFMIISFFAIPAISAEGAPVHIEISALIDDPSTYDGKRVVVDAAVESDRRHAVLLVSRISSKKGIFIELADGAEKDRNVQRLLDAIYSRRNSDNTDITGVFVGTFRYAPGQSPSRIFILESIRSIENNGVKEQETLTKPTN